MKDKLIYTAEDFERYHSGVMPPGEMHTLEKRALDDPFLADALEGYQYTNTASADLASINKKILPGKKLDKAYDVRSISMWIKIAVTLLLIVGGYLAYRLTSSKIKEPVLAKHSIRTQESTDTFGSLKKDSNILIASTFPGKTYTNTLGVSHHKNANKSIQNEPGRIATREPDSGTSRNGNLVLAFPQFQNDMESVVSLNHPVNLNVKNRKTDSDSTALASVIKADSVAIGYSASRSLYKDRKGDLEGKAKGVEVQQEIVLDRKEEVPRLERPQNLKLKQEVSIPGFGNISAYPMGGWENFNRYISRHNTLSAKDPGIDSGRVELSFIVNKKGHPVDVHVIRSMCSICDEKALTLLIQGPKWKRINDKKNTILIPIR